MTTSLHVPPRTLPRDVEHFDVTYVGSEGDDRSWNVAADSPQEAIAIAVGYMLGAGGTYSAWDPQDPFGMPVAELDVAGDEEWPPTQ